MYMTDQYQSTSTLIGNMAANCKFRGDQIISCPRYNQKQARFQAFSSIVPAHQLYQDIALINDKSKSLGEKASVKFPWVY